MNMLRPVVTGLCTYEAIAILTGRIPTLTSIQERYRCLGPVIVGGLFVHFYINDIQKLCDHWNIRGEY